MKVGSLFTGIGGFDLGFEQAGFECLWQVEKDKDCNKVLSKHWPNVTRFDDVTTVGKLRPVDLICGGFPCQDLSVAGKRAGLAGERSGLWFEFLRIIECNQPRWVVIENVPGLLSSDEGRDFAAILRGLVNVGYCLAWRIIDAQYDGVAQRRRRVFIVGSLGNGSAAEILFESEGVSWNPPTRREARARATSCAETSPTLGSSNFKPTKSTSGAQADFCIAATLDQRGRGPTDSVMMNLQIAHALRSEGADASEDGTGRGTPIVVAGTLAAHQKKHGHAMTTQQAAESGHLIAFSSKDCGADAGQLSPTLRAQNFDKSHINGGGQVAIAFAQNSRDEVRVQGDGHISAKALRSGASHSYQGVGVRRLTPRECERLQGFPDDFTRWDAEGKEISDSARYRMLGNAVAVPCSAWIGKRIEQHSTLSDTASARLGEFRLDGMAE